MIFAHAHMYALPCCMCVLQMYAHMYICTYVCMHTEHVRMYMCTHTYVHVHTYVCTCAHIRTWAHMHTYMCTHTYVHVHTCVRTCAYIRTYMSTSVCTYRYSMYICTYVHLHSAALCGSNCDCSTSSEETYVDELGLIASVTCVNC